ncbi:MAG TPA: DUF3263 domain-containing protein [Naasia sp.]
MLSTQERAILAFEDRYPRHTGIKEERIHLDLQLPPAVYYARLQVLLADPEAEAEHPMLIHRLRRLQRQREDRRKARQQVRRGA